MQQTVDRPGGGVPVIEPADRSAGHRVTSPRRNCERDKTVGGNGCIGTGIGERIAAPGPPRPRAAGANASSAGQADHSEVGRVGGGRQW